MEGSFVSLTENKGMILITGTSRGLGKAIAENYLQQGKRVIGIGRTHTINHNEYESLFCDLMNPQAVSNLSFPDFSGEKEITFIHNAGILGEIGYFGQVSDSNFESVFQINLFAGTHLVSKLLKEVQKHIPLTIVFISSGAGRNPMASWSAYCASKAAVDMFCQTLFVEQSELGRDQFHCFSVAPGVVDTDMQAAIRQTNEERFRMVQKFKDYHQNKELYPTDVAANKLRTLLENKNEFGVLCSLREIK